jgi:hypothetical protein
MRGGCSPMPTGGRLPLARFLQALQSRHPAALGAQVARAPLAPGGSPRRVSTSVARANPSRSAQDHRLAGVPHRDASTARERRDVDRRGRLRVCRLFGRRPRPIGGGAGERNLLIGSHRRRPVQRLHGRSSRCHPNDLRSTRAGADRRCGGADAPFLAAHPQEEHGRHRYRFADTGLDPGEWRERTRRYQEYFDVPSEP